jgi:hypothetical protein
VGNGRSHREPTGRLGSGEVLDDVAIPAQSQRKQLRQLQGINVSTGHQDAGITMLTKSTNNEH